MERITSSTNEAQEARIPKSKKKTLLATGDKVVLSVNAKAKYRRSLSQLGVNNADDEFRIVSASGEADACDKGTSDAVGIRRPQTLVVKTARNGAKIVVSEHDVVHIA